MNQRPNLLIVLIILRLPKRLKKRKRITAGTKEATEPFKIKDHKKAPLQAPGSTTLLPLRVEIHKRNRTEAVDRTQPRLPARIATKKAIMQTSVQDL